MDYQEVALLVVGMVGPVILACGAFFSRKYLYAGWAKAVFVIAIFLGLAWGILGFILSPPVHVTRQTYMLLLSLKNICAGMLMGFLLSTVIARPYQKPLPADSDKAPTNRPNQSLEPTTGRVDDQI